MLDTILVVIILIAAVAFFTYSQVKKFQRLSAPNGGCGGHCENCPFAGKCGGRHDQPKKPGGGCGCGCGG